MLFYSSSFHPSPLGVSVFSPALLQSPSHISMYVSLQYLVYSPFLHFLLPAVSPPPLVFFILASLSALSASLCVFSLLISRLHSESKIVALRSTHFYIYSASSACSVQRCQAHYHQVSHRHSGDQRVVAGSRTRCRPGDAERGHVGLSD